MSINRSGETIVELETQSRKLFDFTSFVGYFMFYWSFFAAAKIEKNAATVQVNYKIHNKFDICLNATNAVTEMERGHVVLVC